MAISAIAKIAQSPKRPWVRGGECFRIPTQPPTHHTTPELRFADFGDFGEAGNTPPRSREHFCGWAVLAISEIAEIAKITKSPFLGALHSRLFSTFGI